MRWICRAILRYFPDNLPVTTLDLQFGIHTAFHAAKKLIMQAASKSSLQELHLAILAASFTLPDEIFSIDYLEIDDVPCLRYYDARGITLRRPVLFKMDTIGSLRELYLENVSMDDAFSDMIKSKFPFLESLTLSIKSCREKIMNIRCVTLQSLKIQFWEEKQIEVQVYAPKLHSYVYTGCAVPSLLFPTIAPKQIKIHLMLKNPNDHLFFLKMRETLKLSSKFNIVICCVRRGVRLVPFNIDDVRSMVPFPATNVEQLLFLTVPNEGLWENSLIFDGVFPICHPMYVKSDYELRLKVANYFLKLIVKGVIENCEEILSIEDG
ncbi:hypothetical protein Tco_0874326 [Tanacetum coccineum]|uniref:Uncharacterized protein n=1 Tax=Tanacetum coccineum TaxID=301880 RepID=A0ABQ5BLB4_9ASTR